MFCFLGDKVTYNSLYCIFLLSQQAVDYNHICKYRQCFCLFNGCIMLHGWNLSKVFNFPLLLSSFLPLLTILQNDPYIKNTYILTYWCLCFYEIESQEWNRQIALKKKSCKLHISSTNPHFSNFSPGLIVVNLFNLGNMIIHCYFNLHFPNYYSSCVFWLCGSAVLWTIYSHLLICFLFTLDYLSAINL